jgi:hypothetical protein
MGNKRTGSKESPFLNGFENAQIMEHLEAIASELAVQIRYERGEFHSSGCRVEDQRLIILQRSDTDAAKISALMRELGCFDLSGMDVHPVLLERIQKIHQEVDKDYAAAQEDV